MQNNLSSPRRIRHTTTESTCVLCTSVHGLLMCLGSRLTLSSYPVSLLRPFDFHSGVSLDKMLFYASRFRSRRSRKEDTHVSQGTKGNIRIFASACRIEGQNALTRAHKPHGHRPPGSSNPDDVLTMPKARAV